MIVALQGGLANTLFQYAFGRSVSIVKKESLFFQNCLVNKDHHVYGLDNFHTKVNFGGKIRHEYHELEFSYDPKVYEQREDTLFVGYFQTEKYFNESILREEIRMKTAPSMDYMKWLWRICLEESSCFIHVRRSDYIREPHKSFHGNLSMTYYDRAVTKVRERDSNTKFFVFSDDPDWCRGVFTADNFVIVDHPNAYESLFLMKLCRHAIIANSSFSWFGAWLGDERKQDRIVIAPEQWFSKESGMRYEDVVPERWTKIPNA